MGALESGEWNASRNGEVGHSNCAKGSAVSGSSSILSSDSEGFAHKQYASLRTCITTDERGMVPFLRTILTIASGADRSFDRDSSGAPQWSTQICIQLQSAESPIQVRHMGMKSLIYFINAWPRMPNQPCVQVGEKCLADRHPSPQNQTYLLIDSSCPTRGVEVPRGTRGFASVFPDPK